MSLNAKFSAPLIAIFLAAGFLGLSDHAFAHAHLVSAIPAAGAMAMPPPTELRLKFSEGLELKFSKVKVTGPDKKIVKSGPVRLDPNDDTLLIVPLTAPMPAGNYTVDWQVLSTDGHKTNGTYRFESMQ